jgi:hypothetical protein
MKAIAAAITLMLATPLAIADVFYFPMTKTPLLEDQSSKLLAAIDNSSGTNDLVANLALAFPEVRIVIERPIAEKYSSVNYDWLSADLITYEDKRVSEIERLRVEDVLGESVGIYLRAVESILKADTIAYRSNVPRSVIIHEFLHYLLAQSRNKSKPKSIEGFSDCETIEIQEVRDKWQLGDNLIGTPILDNLFAQARCNDAEHMDIPFNLLRNQKRFKLTRTSVVREIGKAQGYEARVVQRVSTVKDKLLELEGRNDIYDSSLVRAISAELQEIDRSLKEFDAEFKLIVK